MSLRIDKVNELIKQEVGKIILLEADLPNSIMVTVMKAETSKDLRYADVFVSVFPFEKKEEVIKILEENIYFMQKILNKRLFMKPLPKIRFKIDESGEYVGKIDEILKKTIIKN